MFSGICVELPEMVVAIAKKLPIPALRHVFDLPKRLNQYGHQAIQNMRSAAAANESTGKPNICVFTKLGDSEKNASLTDFDVEHEASNLIVAGSDTTGISLTYAIWALLRPQNVSCKAKLIAELKNSSAGTPLSALPYLTCIIKEALRLYGAAPGSLPRMVSQGGAVLGGYHMPEGTTVSTQAYTFHRDPQVFPDPEKFEPERWLDPTKEMIDAFMPFGTGSRICLGIHLAMLELQLGIATFFKECPTARILPSTTDESMEFINYFLIAPKGGKCEIIL